MNFRVTLRQSGRTYHAAQGTSILSAGLSAGHSLAYSCRAGVCGTCKCKVLEGNVDHGNVSQAYLPESERKQGFALICQAKPLSDVVIDAQELSGLAGIRSRITPCRVVKLERAASDVMVVRVRLPMNENLMFVPGQYADFLLPGGERRTYSIANASSAQGVTELEFHMRYMPDGLFTTHVFNAMGVRDLLTLEVPLGTFFIREESKKPMIFIAGGTGFAPIKSMLLDVFARRVHEVRPTHLYWGARTQEGLYMLDLAREWAARYPNFTFSPVVSDPIESGIWDGRKGLVHNAVLEDHADLSGYQVYVSGAPVLVESAKRDFIADRGLDPHNFFADEFLPATNKKAALMNEECIS
ncbi:CDP-6-deoxy-delta-3,4-glucoseen reductase [Pseudomonas sp. PGPR40]|uniref:CDP-6-deoxy-delta-3,4-glucoseen reductase n=1 Tax=Pseudomonas sp. PGPR40 TaxID=2913476 RepID=UPI001EDB9CE8|nr:CDP-6-deoxy-delta-3,4-glucoseen reductase [Pseudomonas sp. PGPR40]